MITAKELAAKLGVSPSAVSIALNGRKGISEKTRQRILEEARKLGYQGMRGPYKKKDPQVPTSGPGSQSASLLQPSAGMPFPGNRNVRYVIFLDSGMAVRETSFYSIVLQGIEAQARELGINVLVSYFDAGGDWASQMEVLKQESGGIILLATEVRDEHIRRYLDMDPKPDLPVCLVDNATSLADVDCVVSDNLRGAYRAVKYLFDRGFQDVGYLRSRTRIDSFDEREAGVRKAREELGVPGSQKLPVVEVSVSSDQAYQDMCDHLEAGLQPERAYFADNDIIAAACVRAMKAHGYRVPEDVSVIGFDDMPLCSLLEPPLTTVGVEKELIGRLAMQLLYRRMLSASEHNLPSFLRITSSAKLILRESVR